MARAFEDQEAVARILESGEDPAIYTSRYPDIPNEPGYLAFLTTIISLGTVGSEFYMTKGHHHRDSAELYIGLSGQGMMIMESHGGGWDFSQQELVPSASVYVPRGGPIARSIRGARR
ncbi:MAG: glucose-6-phosphate isomerase family protein [Acidimicrobiales bacterium]